MWPFECPEQLVLAEFLFSKVQMSARDTNFLMRIWDAWGNRHKNKEGDASEDSDCNCDPDCNGNFNEDCNCNPSCGCSNEDDDLCPPFTGQRNLLSTIDSIPQGDIPWQGFKVSYQGEIPKNAPSWMTATYDVWFQNPLDVMENILGNPEFAEHMDYTVKEVRGEDGERIFVDLMSGDWAWEQSVRRPLPYSTPNSYGLG
jgi:hypothetical protein